MKIQPFIPLNPHGNIASAAIQMLASPQLHPVLLKNCVVLVTTTWIEQNTRGLQVASKRHSKTIFGHQTKMNNLLSNTGVIMGKHGVSMIKFETICFARKFEPRINVKPMSVLESVMPMK